MGERPSGAASAACLAKRAAPAAANTVNRPTHRLKPVEANLLVSGVGLPDIGVGGDRRATDVRFAASGALASLLALLSVRQLWRNRPLSAGTLLLVTLAIPGLRLWWCKLVRMRQAGARTYYGCSPHAGDVPRTDAYGVHMAWQERFDRLFEGDVTR